MLETQDLKSIHELMQEMLDAQSKRLEQSITVKVESAITNAKDEIIGAVGTMIEQNVPPQFDLLYTKMDKLETRMGNLDARMGNLETKFDALDSDVRDTNRRTFRLETSVETLERKCS